MVFISALVTILRFPSNSFYVEVQMASAHSPLPQSITLERKRHIGPRNQKSMPPCLIRSLLNSSPNLFHHNSAARANSKTYSTDEIVRRKAGVEGGKRPREAGKREGKNLGMKEEAGKGREGDGTKDERLIHHDLGRVCI